MKLTTIFSGILTAIVIFFSAQLAAQSNNIGPDYWSKTERQLLTSSTGADQYVFAHHAAYFSMNNYDALHASVLNANSGEIIQLPMADGRFHAFTFEENTTMAEGLKANFPLIRSYNIVSTESRNTWGKMEVTHHGLNAVILIPGESSQYITPVFMNDKTSYMVYERSEFYTEQQFQCHVEDESDADHRHADLAKSAEPLYDCELRNYHIAISATGEFTNSQGGDVEDALAAMVVTVDNLNAVYEREFATNLTLIEETTNAIFTNPSNDPFNNNSLDAMIDQNVSVLQDNIGTGFYDVGHVFGTVGGGLAQLNSACLFSGKERGATGSVFAGGPFPADVVAHELGHQFGASHVFNNQCSGNVAEGTSVEAGAGTTIMSYAGVCFAGPQNYSYDVYNRISLEQIGIEFENDGCAETSGLDNNPPVLEDLPNVVYIPISTPFALTVDATDEDGDVLTYLWEQQNAYRLEHHEGTPYPDPTFNEGPAFRGFEPDLSPTRYLPSTLNAMPTTWEVLADVARGYYFSVTVRDNAPGGGCNQSDIMEVYTIAEAGPFVVQYPSATSISWDPYTTETVLWDVANTTIDPINAELVDIFLSVDGGENYDIQLADNVPNDGAHPVAVPNVETSDARIRVISSAGTFFDVSNNEFTINGFSQGFYFDPENNAANVCQDGELQLVVDIMEVGDYTDEIALSVSGAPADVTVSISPETAFAGDPVTITISDLTTTPAGSYPITLDGVGVDFQNVTALSFGVVNTDAVSATPVSPANDAIDIGTYTELEWTDNATVGITYTLELALDAEFNDIVLTETELETASFEVSGLLPASSYFWRVTNSSVCGMSTPSVAFQFTTVQCLVHEYTESSTSIPDNTPAGLESPLFVNWIGQIADVNVVDITGAHNQISDLGLSIISPNGTEVALTSGNCGMYLTIMPNGEIIVDVPESLSGTYACSGSSNFGDPVPGNGISGRLVYAYDDSGNPQALCDEALNADEIAGNIALVYRGVCNFQTKVLNAQEAGAIAVIVANNQPGNGFFDIGGEDEDVEIPSVMVSNEDGNLFRDNQGGGVSGFSFSFDDQALNSQLPCPATDGGTYLPEGNLSDFIGESSSGNWKLKIVDGVEGNAGALDGWALQFCFDGGVVLSTGERSQIEAAIYPNPTSDIVHVQLQSDIATKISLLDIAGRIVETQVPTAARTQFDLSGLADGLYLIKIEGPTFGQSIHKVLKN